MVEKERTEFTRVVQIGFIARRKADGAWLSVVHPRNPDWSTMLVMLTEEKLKDFIENSGDVENSEFEVIPVLAKLKEISVM